MENKKRWGRSKGFVQSQVVRDKIRAGVKAAYEKRKLELERAGLLAQE